MMKAIRRFGIVAVAVVSMLAATERGVLAEKESSVLVDEPVAEPLLVPATHAEPIPNASQTAPYLTGNVQLAGDAQPIEELATPAGNEIVARPVARIDYDVTRRARKKFAGAEFVELTMITQNPADKCFYEIPMCLPVCCVGEPKVDSYCGLMGRGVVVYCYECGLEIEVKFRLRGDVEVEYGT
jgi:hypothetical protein